MRLKKKRRCFVSLDSLPFPLPPPRLPTVALPTCTRRNSKRFPPLPPKSPFACNFFGRAFFFFQHAHPNNTPSLTLSQNMPPSLSPGLMIMASPFQSSTTRRPSGRRPGFSVDSSPAPGAAASGCCCCCCSGGGFPAAADTPLLGGASTTVNLRSPLRGRPRGRLCAAAAASASAAASTAAASAPDTTARPDGVVVVVGMVGVGVAVAGAGGAAGGAAATALTPPPRRAAHPPPHRATPPTAAPPPRAGPASPPRQRGRRAGRRPTGIRGRRGRGRTVRAAGRCLARPPRRSTRGRGGGDASPAAADAAGRTSRTHSVSRAVAACLEPNLWGGGLKRATSGGVVEALSWPVRLPPALSHRRPPLSTAAHCSHTLT